MGFAKAYAVEQGLREAGRGLLVKAVDFEPGRKTAEPAEQLIAETLYDPGVIEVGYRGGLRFSVTLAEQPLAVDDEPVLRLGPDSVFVVTGAAGGITSAIVADLAAASRGVFYLLDLAQLPERDDPHVALFRSEQGREALKAALIEEARAAGTRPTPAQIDRQLAAVERAEAALRSVEAVEAAGGTAHYHSLDLRDGEAAAAVIEDIRQRYGRIDVLIHAAGLLVDRTLPDKEPSQFDLVFDVKADGFYHLLHAARGLPIAATVAFSSVAGRFGNNGQTDYSAANDLLCKLTSSLRRWRPGTRAHRARLDRLGRRSAWPPAARCRRSWRRSAWTCCRPTSECRPSAASWSAAAPARWWWRAAWAPGWRSATRPAVSTRPRPRPTWPRGARACR